MKTSKIKIRPFIPIFEPEEREPFAVLKYGNIEIELDYTIMRSLTIDNKSLIATANMANKAFDEILKEMDFNITGLIMDHHRDGKHGGLNSS